MQAIVVVAFCAVEVCNTAHILNTGAWQCSMWAVSNLLMMLTKQQSSKTRSNRALSGIYVLLFLAVEHNMHVSKCIRARTSTDQHWVAGDRLKWRNQADTDAKSVALWYWVWAFSKDFLLPYKTVTGCPSTHQWCSYAYHDRVNTLWQQNHLVAHL